MAISYLYRIAAYICGLSVLSFGITLIIRSGLGVGPWDALLVGLSNLTPLTIGNWIIVNGIFLLIINAILLKKKPDLPALITVFLLGNLVDFWFHYTSIHPSSTLIQYILFALGLIIMAFGVAVYTRANFAITPIDQMMFVISDITGYSVRKSRIISEGIALILALLVKGPIGIGTLMVFFFLGPLIQFFISSIQFLAKMSRPNRS